MIEPSSLLVLVTRFSMASVHVATEFNTSHADPYSWPSFRCALDRGSDGRSAMFFLWHSEHSKLNIEAVWGPSHDITRDIEGAISDRGTHHLFEWINLGANNYPYRLFRSLI